MKYFFPDAQDLVDPSFNFQTERRNATRMRQRDDLYAHEVFETPAFDGLLVSKGIVDGFGATGSRYSIAQRQRFLRLGAPEFLRTRHAPQKNLPVMGDCGAFTYVKEEKPPYTVEEVVDFYTSGDFDLGISVDHVILDYQPKWDGLGESAPVEVQERQKLTLALAKDFLREHKATKPRWSPMGVAQGWSPKSYARAVKELQKLGYDYIALGGMVPLKSPEILASLEAIATVRKPETRLHLLGITRTEHLTEFRRLGVASFDSTSPLRQAFKDEKNNYYTMDGALSAVRIPQVEGNAQLLKKIQAGQVNQPKARALERAALAAVAAFANRTGSLEAAVAALREYELLYDPESDHEEVYRSVLDQRPWEKCECDICRALGHHVLLFRGAERNRRRGFHNVWTFYRRLQREVGGTVGKARSKTLRVAERTSTGGRA